MICLPAVRGKRFTSPSFQSSLWSGNRLRFQQHCFGVNRLAIIREFWEFLRERKKWWLLPIVAFLLVLGGLLVFAKGSALAPFIYSLF